MKQIKKYIATIEFTVESNDDVIPNTMECDIEHMIEQNQLNSTYGSLYVYLSRVISVE